MEQKMSPVNQQIELSIYEKFLMESCLLGDYLVMSTAFIESSDTIEDLSLLIDLVKRALGYMMKRHPFLRACFDYRKKEDKMLLRIFENDVTDKIIFEYCDLTKMNISDKRLIEETEIFFSKNFDFAKNENLLWKFQFISYKDNTKFLMNLVIVPVITDGLNILTLTVEFINILNALLTGQECTEMKIKLDTVDNLHAQCEKSNLIKTKNGNQINSIDKDNHSFLFPEKLRSDHESGFKLDFLKLDKEMTKKIIEKSKLNKIHLSAFFHTIAFYALKDLYEENSLEFPKQPLVNIVASLRIRYKPMLDFSHLGSHISVLKFPIDEKHFGEYRSFWKDAQYINGLIQKNVSLENGSLFEFTHDFETLNKYNEIFKNSSLEEAQSKASRTLSCDFAISNLGAFVNNRAELFRGPMGIKQVYCSDLLQSNPSISSALMMHIVYWRGEMMIQFGTNKSRLDSAYSDRFIRLYQDKIKNILF